MKEKKIHQNYPQPTHKQFLIENPRSFILII